LNVFFVVLKGMAVGGANVMPGISGATLAVIFRVDGRLIESINSITKDWRRALAFLAPFVIGMTVGIVAVGSVFSILIERFSFQSAGFIAGLMAGSLPFLFSQAQSGLADKKGDAESATPKIYYIAAVIAAILVGAAALLIEQPEIYAQGTIGAGAMALLFFGGMLAAAAMIVPGVSGAMVLALLGIYPVAMDAINQIRIYLSEPTAFELLPPILRIVVPVGLGIIPGVLLAGRGIAYLLEKHCALTYYVIIGLVLGTVFALFVNPDTYQSGDITPLAAGTAIIAFVCAAFLAKKLSKRAG
jgi:putative membrane protein